MSSVVSLRPPRRCPPTAELTCLHRVQLSPQIKMVPRATSTSADCYLTPVLKLYLQGFFDGFEGLSGDGSTGGARVEFLTSEGTLVNVSKFGGLKSLLSGPAGGVVGYSLTSWDNKVRQPLIGFDMVSSFVALSALQPPALTLVIQ